MRSLLVIIAAAALAPLSACETTITQAPGANTPPQQPAGQGEPSAPAQPDPTQPTSPPTVDPATGDVMPQPEVATWSCQSDDQCVVSCTNQDQCCDELCGCNNVYHRDQLAKIQQANATKCAGQKAHCPVVRCRKPEWETTARCVNNQCTGEQVPFASRTENGFFMSEGTPAPQACTTATDCVADTVPTAAGCCDNPRSLQPQSKAYQQWVATWRQSSCTAVTCPPPPSPPRPRHCAVQMQCLKGTCANSCDAAK